MTAEDFVPTVVRADAADPRWVEVSGPHGTASLAHTHWLTASPAAYEGAPGEWAAVDATAVGTSVGEHDRVILNPGETIIVGDLLLKAINRDGALALRVFDPASPGRTQLRGISAFPYDAKWAIPGQFTPAGDGATMRVQSVDGYERDEPALGTVALQIDGEPVNLAVTQEPWGLAAVVADGTSGVDSYRFRFVPVSNPDATGAVTVDFNRAVVPPCGFSDQYLCPLPQPNNRLTMRIEAGEALPVR